MWRDLVDEGSIKALSAILLMFLHKMAEWERGREEVGYKDAFASKNGFNPILKEK